MWRLWRFCEPCCFNKACLSKITGRKTTGLIHLQLAVMVDFLPVHIFQRTIRLRRAIGGNTVCECAVGVLCWTAVTVMSHCDIHDQVARRNTIVFSTWQDHVTRSNPLSRCLHLHFLHDDDDRYSDSSASSRSAVIAQALVSALTCCSSPLAWSIIHFI